MHRFHVAPEAARERPILLRGAALRHLRDVLRLRSGTNVEVFDGAGGNWLAEIVSVGPSVAELAPIEVAPVLRESSLALTLAVGLSKAAKLDWTIEKATELGVVRIVPFVSERTVPRGQPSDARAKRWGAIASSAAAQSGRAVCPLIDPIRGFETVLAMRSAYHQAVFFWEAATAALERDVRAAASALLVIGAEGGFSSTEASAAAAAGFELVRLGPRILRAETAAVAAAALVQFLWGDLAAHPPRR